MYLFTDADDKDKDKLPNVEALIAEKGLIRVDFVLTAPEGCPSRRRKRGNVQLSYHYPTMM